VDQGTHRDLLARNRDYADLVNAYEAEHLGDEIEEVAP